MKKRFRNSVAMLLSVIFISGILPLSMFKSIKVEAAALATKGGATDLVNKILGPGITASNISFTGNEAQGATFTNADFMPFSDGIILSTGKADSVFISASTQLSTAFNSGGDAALTSIYQAGGFSGITHDAASLEFTVTPTSNKLSFKYIFASEEYDQGANYNDVFALYVGGQNIAVLPNGNTVSIQNTKNTAYHINNTSGSSIGFLGYTTELSCEATVIPNTPVTIRLVIADADDSAFDSAVFIKANSINFVAVSAPVLSDVSTNANVGANISATSNKAGTLYLVPKGTYDDKTALDAVSSKITVACNSNIAANINTSGLAAGTYQVYGVDSSNVMSAPSQDITLVSPDTTPPTFSILGNSTTWTRNDVTLSISASDVGAGLNTSGAYSFDDGATWTTSNTQSFSSNRTVKIKVRDNSGNISSQNIVIDKIDKTAPSITSVTGNSTDWTKDSVTLTVNASDAMSGLAEKAYSFDGGQTWQESNEKTYDSNTDGIVVKVKDAVENIATYETINITKIDKSAPSAAVIGNASSYTESSWYNENQTITASFTNTAGCSEKLQYKVDDAAWTDGQAITINAEGKYTVSFRVIDSLGRTSEEQTVKVNLDKTAPTNAKITVKDREFTSFLNTITFGTFFKETVNVSIAADSNISGVNKVEYQKVSSVSDYKAEGTWTEGASFNVVPDENFVVYAKVTDNAGNYVIINSDGVVVDATKPVLALTSDVNGWTKNNVSVKVKVSDNLAGLKAVTYTTDEATPQSGTVAITNGEGTIILANQGQYKVTVLAKDSSLNEVTQTADIKVDKTLPSINGVTGNSTDWTKDSVTLTVNASDAMSGLAEKAYSFDGGQTWQESNTKTYDSNTDGIVVKVKDAVENIATYETINITKIDKSAPSTAVIGNASSYTESSWYNENQTITASFTNTAGCSEKLQYKVDEAVWTDGAAITINAEGKYTVSYRVMDSLGRTSEEQTVKVNLDKTAPTNAKITVKDREFTSFLNTITFGTFFKETVNVSIAADSNISGINNVEYQKVSSVSDYKAEGTWIEGTSFNVVPDEKFIGYAKVTDNAGNYVIINSDGVIVDATKPALELTPDANDWTKNNVNVKVKVSDNLAGLKAVTYTTDEATPQSGTVVITSGEGTITLTNEGQYKLTVTAKDNSLNEISESAVIKIDKTKPIITGATESLSYFIGSVIKINDALGEIAEATYQNGTDSKTSFKDGDLFEKAGKYILTLRDKAGNLDAVSFEIKALPKVQDIVYTADCKALIDSIRAEFDKHNDLPEPYKTDTDNKIKALEGRYSQLDKEVTEIKTETSVIKDKVDKLPSGVDGLLNLQKEIQNEYNKIVGNASPLTAEEKKALEKEAEYLKQQLNIIGPLQNQIDNIKIQVSNIDTKDNGLISQEGKMRGLLSDIEKLTKEQQSILQPQIDLLNSLLGKSATLKEQVKNLKEMINSLPAADKITKQDSENIYKINQLYSNFTNEQKELLGADLIKLLSGATEALNKLMLHDDKTDITVLGIDGTSFTSDIYLLVTPIKADGTSAAKFSSAAVSIESATKNVSQLEGKELLALYDISLFRDNIKIQPNGKVKVKIKIPDNLIRVTGLDIVHIADDGKVTPMNATVEDGYLVFITTHFSDYAIVGKAITKEIPKTGSAVDFNSLISLGMLFLLMGLFFARKKRV